MQIVLTLGLYCDLPQKAGWRICLCWEEESKVKGWIVVIIQMGALLWHSGSWGTSIHFEFSQLEMFSDAWSAQHIEVGSSRWIWICLVSRVGRRTPLLDCLSKYEPAASGDVSSALSSASFVSLWVSLSASPPLSLSPSLTSLPPLLTSSIHLFCGSWFLTSVP